MQAACQQEQGSHAQELPDSPQASNAWLDGSRFFTGSQPKHAARTARGGASSTLAQLLRCLTKAWARPDAADWRPPLPITPAPVRRRQPIAGPKGGATPQAPPPESARCTAHAGNKAGQPLGLPSWAQPWTDQCGGTAGALRALQAAHARAPAAPPSPPGRAAPAARLHLERLLRRLARRLLHLHPSHARRQRH